MHFTTGPIPGLVIIDPVVRIDPRGFFMETYRRDLFAAAGITCDFVQDNHSCSTRNTVRGLHFQTHPGQAKLVRCTRGMIWDVAVDMRLGSPTLGKWAGQELSAANKRLFFIPVGFAHGFAVLSDEVEVQYQCSAYYDPAGEAGFQWNDPEIAVDWRITGDPILSERDIKAPPFSVVRARMEGRS